MNELNLAIIDDGIADCFKQDIDKFVVTNGKVMPNNATAANDRISHGTICLGIILKYANIPLHITSIKILKDNFRGDADNLDIALAWCIANNIDIINLSLGSTIAQDIPKYLQSLQKAYECGITIIAANNNNGTMTFPSSFDTVIGVRHADSNMPKQLTDNYLGINFGLTGTHSIEVENQQITVHSSNSYATAYFTGLICNSRHRAKLKAQIIDIQKPTVLSMRMLSQFATVNYFIESQSLLSALETFPLLIGGALLPLAEYDNQQKLDEPCHSVSVIIQNKDQATDELLSLKLLQKKRVVEKLQPYPHILESSLQESRFSNAPIISCYISQGLESIAIDILSLLFNKGYVYSGFSNSGVFVLTGLEWNEKIKEWPQIYTKLAFYSNSDLIFNVFVTNDEKPIYYESADIYICLKLSQYSKEDVVAEIVFDCKQINKNYKNDSKIIADDLLSIIIAIFSSEQDEA